MNSSGASLSTRNQDSTSVSFSLIGCHCRSDTKGRTSSESATLGQLWTRLRFGKTDAAETMKPSRPIRSSCSADHAPFIRSTISSG